MNLQSRLSGIPVILVAVLVVAPFVVVVRIDVRHAVVFVLVAEVAVSVRGSFAPKTFLVLLSGADFAAGSASARAVASAVAVVFHITLELLPALSGEESLEDFFALEHCRFPISVSGESQVFLAHEPT